MMTERTVEIKLKRKVINDIYLDTLEDYDTRYLVYYGGAGSGKSYFIAQRYIYKLLKVPITNLLVVRNVSDTNRDSTFALFKQVIIKWKLSQFFKINQSDMCIKCLINGNEIKFKGLDDAEKLKSFTFTNGELTDIWCEEVSEILEEDFNQLNIRLRGVGNTKQVVVSFNPINVNHWLKRKFMDNPPDKCRILHTTYKDNKFLDDDYKTLLESYKDTDPYYYSVYCMGQWGVLGNTIFDAQKVNERIQSIQNSKPAKVGYFLYLEVNGRINRDSIKFIDDPKGAITIHEDVKQYYPYVIGCDTAGEGSDMFASQVIDNTCGNQVAVLHQKYDEDLFSKQLYCLGVYYNTALIGIEANFSTYPIKELQRLGYQKQFYREEEDKITKKRVKKYGFKTTSLTRPLIIAELVELVREHTEMFNDQKTLLEMLTFVRNENGRAEAMQGAHDDLVMSIAIAYYCSSQQTKKVTIPSKKVYQNNNEYNSITGY